MSALTLPRSRGFSLIELMIALVLGLFLVGGVIAVFEAASKSNHVQQGLARVLENGRYGSQYLADELRMAGAQYCASFATSLPTGSGQNPARPLYMNVVDSKRPVWLPPQPPAAPAPYTIDPSVLVRGYDCDASDNCTPALPTKTTDVNVVPATGTAKNLRVKGTDVLTIRYLNGDGATIASTAGGTAPIDVGSSVSSAPLNFDTGDLAMIADCGTTEIFATQGKGSSLTHTTDDGNFVAGLAGAFNRKNDARVFNFNKDFVSVTYFVGLEDDPEQSGHVIPALMRIVNGAAPEVVVEGVERLDFTYSVVDGQGGVHFLDASEVDSNAPAVTCPPLKGEAPNSTVAGCLWRGVQGIEVSMLLDSVRDDGPGDEPFHYSPDGAKTQSYKPGDKQPSGLDAGRMVRREFRFLATTHNYSR